jgi:anti-sigma factor RsiW
MNCVQSEVRIYLYYELAPEERNGLDQHMASCRSCAELHERLHKDLAALKGVIQVTAPMPDYAAITRNVMSVVEKKQRENSWLERSFLDLLITPVRYAFAVLSVFLVVGFVVEQGPVVESHSKVTVAVSVIPEESILNSELFHRSLTTPRTEAKLSLYDCIVRCMHTEQGNCSDCNSKISKYN